jgi:malonyl-CoA O-methyltransferase
MSVPAFINKNTHIVTPDKTATVSSINKILKIKTQTNFSKAAANYIDNANVQKLAAKDLLELIDLSTINKTKRCIDLGAGPLVNTQKLNDVFGDVLAIDLSLTMLKQSNLPNARICADMDKLPLFDNSIDAVFSNFAVQWSANFYGLLRSLFNVLKPGGSAYISVVVDGTLNELKTAFQVIDNKSHINTFITSQKINDAVRNTGFNIICSNKIVYTDSYSTPLKAIKSLKAIGATSYNRTQAPRGLLTKSSLKTVCDAYPLVNNKACVSYHVVLLALVKP